MITKNTSNNNEKKLPVSIRLPVGLVTEAKSFQKKFAQAENLSGLIESLLFNWCAEQREFEPHFNKFKVALKKKQSNNKEVKVSVENKDDEVAAK